MRSFHLHDFIMGFVLTCFAFFQFDTLSFCLCLSFCLSCVNLSSCPFNEGVSWFSSLICASSLGKEPSTLGLKAPGPDGGTAVAVAGHGGISFPVALPKRRVVLTVCLLPLPSVQSSDSGGHLDGKVYLRGAWIYPMNFFPSLGLCPFRDS